jgi:SAM-dependent methyltransferase
MSEQSEQLVPLGNVEIMYHSYALCAAAYMDSINAVRESNAHRELRVADVGAGNGDFYLGAQQEGLRVQRIDPAYKDHIPKDGDYVTADARHMPQVPSNSFDVSVSSFLFQHLQESPGSVAMAIQEMVRITKPRENGGGLVLIYPLYGAKKFQEEIASRFSDVTGFAHTDEDALSERGYPMTTLAIVKNDQLTPKRLKELTQAIEESGVLSRRKTILDRLRKSKMRVTGNVVNKTKPVV